MCSGFNWYLKHVAKCHISWNGDQLNPAKPLAKVEKTIRRVTPYKYGFYFNYCTFNYTMAWWDWDRWEREIDYMALSGINMPLAIVGSEAFWLVLDGEFCMMAFGNNIHLYGLVHKKGRTQRTMDLEVVCEVQHSRPMDESRLCPAE